MAHVRPHKTTLFADLPSVQPPPPSPGPKSPSLSLPHTFPRVDLLFHTCLHMETDPEPFEPDHAPPTSTPNRTTLTRVTPRQQVRTRKIITGSIPVNLGSVGLDVDKIRELSFSDLLWNEEFTNQLNKISEMQERQDCLLQEVIDLRYQVEEFTTRVPTRPDTIEESVAHSGQMGGSTSTAAGSGSGTERVLKLPYKRPRVSDGEDEDGASAGLGSCILYYLGITDRTLASSNQETPTRALSRIQAAASTQPGPPAYSSGGPRKKLPRSLAAGTSIYKKD